MLLSAAQKGHDAVKAIAVDTYAHYGFSNINYAKDHTYHLIQLRSHVICKGCPQGPSL